ALPIFGDVLDRSSNAMVCLPHRMDQLRLVHRTKMVSPAVGLSARMCRSSSPAIAITIQDPGSAMPEAIGLRHHCIAVLDRSGGGAPVLALEVPLGPTAGSANVLVRRGPRTAAGQQDEPADQEGADTDPQQDQADGCDVEPTGPAHRDTPVHD